jgi:hypothetical protein
MSLAKYILLQQREELVHSIKNYNNLIDIFRDETSAAPEYIQKKYEDRFLVLEALLDAIINYDKSVIRFYELHSNCDNKDTILI